MFASLLIKCMKSERTLLRTSQTVTYPNNLKCDLMKTKSTFVVPAAVPANVFAGIIATTTGTCAPQLSILDRELRCQYFLSRRMVK